MLKKANVSGYGLADEVGSHFLYNVVHFLYLYSF